MMTYNKYQKIIDAMRRQTQERLTWPPEKLREWLKEIHGYPNTRELVGDEAKQMLIVLKLVGHYSSTNNQRTCTEYYEHADKEYQITYGLGDEPLIEEIIYDIQQNQEVERKR